MEHLDQVERRGEDRRKADRREPTLWKKCQGVIAVVGALGSLLMPTYDFLRAQARLQYQFEIDLKRAEIELLKQQLIEKGALEK